MAIRTGRSRRRTVAGFTLIEVLVSISIFSIVAFGVQALFVGLMHTTHLNGQRASAAELAQAELEDLRSLAYTDVDSRSSAATVNGITYSIDSVVAVDAMQAETKLITTTVSWAGPNGSSQAFSLETIYAEIQS